MASDRDYGILIELLHRTLRQARKMEMDLLVHLLQMALLEVAEQFSGGLRSPLTPPQRRPKAH